MPVGQGIDVASGSISGAEFFCLLVEHEEQSEYATALGDMMVQHDSNVIEDGWRHKFRAVLKSIQVQLHHYTDNWVFAWH